MINSVKTILDELDYTINIENTDLAEFFNENGYCVIPKSDLIIENIPLTYNGYTYKKSKNNCK